MDESPKRKTFLRSHWFAYGATWLIISNALTYGWWRSNHSSPISYLKHLTGRTDGKVLK